jgi:tripartite ATP-independent transporter DctM subunit
MDPITFLILIVVVLIILLFSGLEIAWSVGVVAAAGLIWYTGQPVDQLAAATWSSLNSFTLTAMPLFILMGNILGNSGVHERLFNAIDKWVGHLPGGLVCSVIFGNAIFAAMSGSTIAATATFGKIAFPVMEKRNYDPGLGLGAIAASSILAPLIPPSILMIIYGAWQGVSIVDLLAAGVVPGLTLTALFIITVAVRVLLNPALAQRQPKPPLAERLRTSADILPFAVLIFGVLGAIFGGIMTPTEAAALGSALAIVLAFLFKRMTLAVLKFSLMETLKVTSFSLFIMAMASVMSHTLNSAGIIPLVKSYVMSLAIGKYGVIILFFMMYLVMGCFFDSWSMLFLTFPFVMPILTELGVNPIWWGVIYVMAGEQSTITPPFGLSLFVLRSVVPQHPMGTTVRGALPFMVPIYLNIILCIVFPQMALWLPSLIR